MRLTDCLGAKSFALGCGGIDHICEMAISTKNLDPGVAFAAGWEIGTVASLGDVGDLGTGISFPCVWKIGAATSLAVVWDIGTGAFLADAWWIEAATSLGAVQDFGTRAFLVGAWRIGAASSLLRLGIPDKATIEDLSI